MPKSIQIPVKPKLLTWARKSIGLDILEVAKKLNITEEIVNDWESGRQHPRLAQLRKLSNIYKRPLALFFLPSPPKEPGLPSDLRTLPENKKYPLSSKTLLAIRRARHLQSAAIELAKSLERDINRNFEKADLADDPEELASRVRKTLDIDIETQFRWNNDYESFNELKRRIEDLDILVFQLNFPVKEVRGFSLIEKEFPVIAISSNDSIRAKSFSLFHEYSHILLNYGGLCDMRYQNSDFRSAKIEKFCNHVAGAVLVPKIVLLQERFIERIKEHGQPSDELLRTISRKFKVSKEVILRRLTILELVSNTFYDRKHKQWEEESQKEPSKGWALKPADKCIRDLGIPLVSLILESYREERIAGNDVADFLNIRLKHLNDVEKNVGETFE